MTRPIRATLAALALVLGVGLAGLPAAAQDEAAARATAETLVENAHGALKGGETERLRAAIDDAFAFDVWERFLLGERSERFSEAQLSEFRQLLPGFLADLYRDQFGKGLDAKPEIQGVKPARRDLLVSASIPRANGKSLPVDWRVRDFGERGYKVIDVMVGGTSFLILKRDEFAAIVEDGGPDALLDYMRENSV